MLDGYKESFLNMHALRALIKPPVMPAKNLAIAGDDEMSNIPLIIFTFQRSPELPPEMDKLTNKAYEDVAVKGKNDVVQLDNFVTDDFNLGAPMEGY